MISRLDAGTNSLSRQNGIRNSSNEDLGQKTKSKIKPFPNSVNNVLDSKTKQKGENQLLKGGLMFDTSA